MNSGQLIFRPAEKSDLPQVADLRWRFQTDDALGADEKQKAVFIRDFVRFSENEISGSAPELFHWLAISDDEAVSVMSVRIVKKVPKPNRLEGKWGYLTNVYTLPAFRGKGIGADLLAAIKAWAIDQTIEFLIVWPSEAAFPFYERSGFARPDDLLIFDLE